MADIDKVKRNIQRMIDGGASETEIDTYVKSEGTTPEALRATKTPATQMSPADNAMRLLGFPGVSGGSAEALARGAADTATFGWGDEAAAGARTGGGLWGDYGKDLSATQSRIAAAQKANPGAYFGGQVIGAVAPMLIPGVAEITGPARGAGLLSNAGRLAVSGGIAGGAYGAGSANGDMGSRIGGALSGAEMGAGFGAVTPFAGRAIGSAVGYAGDMGRMLLGLSPAMPSATMRAGTALNRAAGDDALTSAQQLGAALQSLGPDAVPADLGPNLQRQAGALASLPGNAQTTLRDALTTRDAGANARISNEVNATLGPAPVPTNIAADIEAGQKALQPEYRAALAQGRAVDTSALALDLESKAVNLRGDAQKAAQDVRRMLNVTGTDQLDPNPGTLFETRNAIDGRLKTEVNPKAIGVLVNARQQIDAMLAQAVPGIKDVDAKFAELARQGEGFQRGQQVLDSGRTAPRPQELADELTRSALPQGNAVGPSAVPFRVGQGARAEIDRIIGTNSNDVVALNKMIKGEGSWNRDRLASLFGQANADRIISLVDRERRYAGTSSVVRTNSETAARQAAQKEVAPKGSGADVNRIPWTFADAIPRAINWVGGERSAAAQRATNEELARLLSMPAPTAGQTYPVANAMTQATARDKRWADTEALANLLLTYGSRAAVPQAINLQRQLTQGSHL